MDHWARAPQQTQEKQNELSGRSRGLALRQALSFRRNKKARAELPADEGVSLPDKGAYAGKPDTKKQSEPAGEQKSMIFAAA